MPSQEPAWREARKRAAAPVEGRPDNAPGLEHGLDEVVGAEDLARLDVLDHPVGKFGNVTGRLEDRGERHDGRVELEHVLLDDKVPAPGVENVGLEGGPGRSIVVEAGDTAIDVERGREKEALEHELVKVRLVERRRCLGSGVGHEGQRARGVKEAAGCKRGAREAGELTVGGGRRGL